MKYEITCTHCGKSTNIEAYKSDQIIGHYVRLILHHGPTKHPNPSVRVELWES
jgi:hypothetical protein